MSYEPGVDCPDCYKGKMLIDKVTGKPVEADERTYGATWETCTTCNGTGKAKPAVNAPPEKRIYPHCAPEGLRAPQCDAAHNPP